MGDPLSTSLQCARIQVPLLPEVRLLTLPVSLSDGHHTLLSSRNLSEKHEREIDPEQAHLERRVENLASFV